MDVSEQETQGEASGDEINHEDPDVIAAINRETVHQICSGQVVLSLAIAAKELVENALDAGATSIEVRLKEHGTDLLEVSDNGNGVRKENFQTLTLKHYTSKLRDFTDLESIGTLGFRGEALSSLCALSQLTVITRHALAEHATKLTYDLSGKITSRTPAAREVGTTVILEKLFASLPVRRKEFTKNIKREFNKMSQLLYAYCLVSKGVKLSCTNVTKSCSRSTIVATEGSRSIKENIISVFGAKQFNCLMEVHAADPNPQIMEEYKLKPSDKPLPFTFECFISSAIHGNGRSATDRQFFYINSRPCEPVKVAKLINEMYRQFNVNQYPFVYLNVNMGKSLVDVNVTPDKRQVFLEEEKLLLAALKSSLLEAFKGCPSTYKVQNVDVSSSLIKCGGPVNAKRGIKRILDDSECKSQCRSITEMFKKRTKSETFSSGLKMELGVTVDASQRDKNGTIATEEPCVGSKEPSIASALQEEPTTPNIDCSYGDFEQPVASTETKNTQSDTLSLESDPEFTDTDDFVTFLTTQDTIFDADEIKAEQLTQETLLDEKKPPRKTLTVRSSMKYLKEALDSIQANREDTDKTIRVRFRSEITPAANATAEKELQKQISKETFNKMEIIGQFNLGFIITKLEDDLFIIDQHASDEKYNFEDLKNNTVLEKQVLVNPKSLELTAADEDLLIDNEEIFRKNGFTFKINHTARATKKVSLTSIPISKNYIFGKDDIDEMLFMLRSNMHAMCRPLRISMMFASRACRKSVMVGCPLTKTDMRKLVDRMGEIDQPWNCPHGRPTMRHLINLKLLEK